jgi:hypothetical protein
MLTPSGQQEWASVAGRGSPWLMHTGRGLAYWVGAVSLSLRAKVAKIGLIGLVA